MLTVNLGPLHLPTPILLMIMALLIAAGVGHLVGRPQRAGIGNILIDMVLVALLVSRITFVAIWFNDYIHAPWSIFDIRDGGFTPWIGLVAGMTVAIWRGWQRPELRKPLALGLMAGAFAWDMSGGAGMLRMVSQTTWPSVTLRTLAGKPTNLAALAKGKPMVVNLWASWCPPCRREMPVLAVAQHNETEVTFVFVNQGEDGTTVQHYLNSGELSIANVLLDSNTEIANEIGSTALPITLFYDAKGRLADARLGELSPATLASKLSDLRARSADH